MSQYLQPKRALLKRQLDVIDLAGMHEAIEAAEQAAADFESDNIHSLRLEATAQKLTALRGAASQAKQNLRSAQSDADRLQRELDHLDTLLNCDQCIIATEAAIQPARDGVTDAQTGLDSALGVQREMENLLAAEQNAYQQQNAQAVTDLLTSARSGAKPAPFRSNRGMVDALTQAHAQAADDVVHAQAAHGAALAALDAVLRARLEAQASASERDLHLAAHGYALALVRHDRACSASRSHFATPDVDMMVGEIKRAAESVGVPGEMLGTPQGAEAR